MNRKTQLTAAALLAGMALVPAAEAQDGTYPNKPVMLVVSAAAGGTTDIAARLISEPLSKALGQSVVVDNKPGGNGTIAAQAVQRAKPDGYTLLVQYSGYHVITPLLTKQPWDPVKDFAPVANLLSAPQVLVVRPSLPVHSLKELVAYAKANPGKLNYASSGNGSLQHVSTELLNLQAGTKITPCAVQGHRSGDDRPAGRQRRPDHHHAAAADGPYRRRQAAPAGGDQQDAPAEPEGCAVGAGSRLPLTWTCRRGSPCTRRPARRSPSSTS